MLILTPGWDDLPIDRPRPRAGWWRRILAGRAGNTRLQPGSCCGCGENFCVAMCGNCSAGQGMPLPNATVTAYHPGNPTPVASCITDATGCCNLGLSNGSYTITVTYDGSVIGSSSVFVTGGVACLVAQPPLTLTDFAGSLTLTYANTVTFGCGINQGGGGWTGCHTFTPTGAISTATASCNAGHDFDMLLGSGAVTLTYSAWCTDTLNAAGCTFPAGQFLVVCSWNFLSYDPTQGPVCGNAGWKHGCTNFNICNQNVYVFAQGSCPSSLNNDSASLVAAPTSTNPFAWSGTLVPTTGSPLNPPGLDVAISA